MRKKLDMELLRLVTEIELNKISKNEIWLSELVEQVAEEYAKHPKNHYPLYSRIIKKIKQSDVIVRNVAQNFGWSAKRKSKMHHFLIEGKWYYTQKNVCRLYRLQEEE